MPTVDNARALAAYQQLTMRMHVWQAKQFEQRIPLKVIRICNGRIVDAYQAQCVEVIYS